MVHISVPLKGAKVGSVDIVCTEEYLKVKLAQKHYPLLQPLHSGVGVQIHSGQTSEGPLRVRVQERLTWRFKVKDFGKRVKKNKNVHDRVLFKTVTHCMQTRSACEALSTLYMHATY